MFNALKSVAFYTKALKGAHTQLKTERCKAYLSKVEPTIGLVKEHIEVPFAQDTKGE